MFAHSYITNPEFFALYRSTYTPFDPQKFQTLMDQLENVVSTNPTFFYESRISGEIGLTNTPRDIGNLATGKEVLVEVDGPLRLPDNKLLDIRIFTKNSKENRSGILAFVGIDWKPTKPIHQQFSSEELAKWVMQGGVTLGTDNGKIDTLWILSEDGDKKWITSYDDGQEITEFEFQQLINDLSQVG